MRDWPCPIPAERPSVWWRFASRLRLAASFKIDAFSAKDSSIVWEYDTNREFNTMNGVPAKGASINGPAPVVVDGMGYVSSGYGAVGDRPGNVFLAFGME